MAFLGYFFLGEKFLWIQPIAFFVLIALGFVGAIMGVIFVFGRLQIQCPFCKFKGVPNVNKNSEISLICTACGLIRGGGFLKLKLVKDNDCSDWPIRLNSHLEISIKPFAVNGLRFQSKMEEARMFGKPDSITGLAKKYFYISYFSKGLFLEYEKGSLVYIGIVFRPDEDVSSPPNTVGANAKLIFNKNIDLTRDTKPDEIILILGKPEIDDVDNEERILTHYIEGYVVETEFNLQNQLKRLNIFLKND
jgi:hypothetical protein